MTLPSSPRIGLPVKTVLASGLVEGEREEVRHGAVYTTRRVVLEIPNASIGDAIELIDLPLSDFEPVSRFDKLTGYLKLEGIKLLLCVIQIPLPGWFTVMILLKMDEERVTFALVALVSPLLIIRVSYWSCRVVWSS